MFGDGDSSLSEACFLLGLKERLSRIFRDAVFGDGVPVVVEAQGGDTVGGGVAGGEGAAGGGGL